jgi:hypothetical protein
VLWRSRGQRSGRVGSSRSPGIGAGVGSLGRVGLVGCCRVRSDWVAIAPNPNFPRDL